ncbi:hypothetical protein VTK56DRAFT_5752 [Thermocarpiscus australiensis]
MTSYGITRCLLYSTEVLLCYLCRAGLFATSYLSYLYPRERNQPSSCCPTSIVCNQPRQISVQSSTKTRRFQHLKHD